MGTASLILGIISFLLAPIPLCGLIALFPALIGLILGSLFIKSAKEKPEIHTGTAIAGIVLNALALLIIAAYLIAIYIFGHKVDSVQHLFANGQQSTTAVSAKSDSASAAKKEIDQEFAQDSAAKANSPFNLHEPKPQGDSTK